MTRTDRLLVGAVALTGCVLAACQPTPAGPPTTAPPPSPAPSSAAPSSAAPSPSPSPTAARCVDGLDLEEQVGQLFMVPASVSSADGTASLLANTRAGSVILMGNSSAGVDATRRVTDAIRANAEQPDGVELLIATDQEGGQVQRLTGPGFGTWPAAIDQAEQSDDKLERTAEKWGTAMGEAGVDSVLAPVADVVPKSLGRANEPVGQWGRQYGSDVDVVGAKVSAVVRGYDAAGVATSVKHFPGLGKVKGNTDHVAKVVDNTTTRNDKDLAAFDDAMEAGTDMVMVSTANYAKIDADHPAAFSSTVIEEMLRDDRGWDGVVASDDLGVAKQVADLKPGQRALRFLQAGGDLVITVDPGTAGDMVRAVRDEAKSDPEFADEVATKAERVLRMKERRGLASCD
ncbi:glycoside hydrolase family 3 N-terminal domain-containing protein [Propionibacteriaceae bacterium Y1685]